ncbi:MAG: ABC transporter permease [Planctomycetota bacterium]
MNVILTTLRKELASYFYNPVAYVIAVLFYLFRGVDVQALTESMARYGSDLDLYTTYYVFRPSSNFMIVLVPPILTMRVFAEEKRTGSLEVLMTAPVRDVEVVLGKWLAAVAFFAILWLPTLPLLWGLSTGPFLDAPLSFGPAAAAYLGLTLLGAFLLAAGCFTSSLTDNLLLAALSAMLFNTAVMAGPGLAQTFIADQNVPAWAETLLEQINVADHLTNWFARGLVDTSQIVFYLAGTAFFLFMTVKSLESRRWR